MSQRMTAIENLSSTVVVLTSNLESMVNDLKQGTSTTLHEPRYNPSAQTVRSWQASVEYDVDKLLAEIISLGKLADESNGGNGGNSGA